ncbi:MAG: UDP-N-acetylmuramoyl-L-alanine--D-glutamate ligase [Corallococcus sp.]|nr:UDP-N-acetylmuramoyl-L-alanine--D-glutamate ligase [Corallococcus sp.]
MSDIIIYGSGRTGKSLFEMLKKLNIDARFYDDYNASYNNIEFARGDIVLLSPGVKPDASGVMKARKVSATVIPELEFCFPYCKGKCISVTGTNGKTTTCEMLNYILSLRGRSVRLLGNGGIPFSAEVLNVKSDEIVVLESSSFQLNNVRNFSPHISVFTNIASDHLDYHVSYDNYVRAKTNNFVRQADDDYAIFNGDDDAVVKLSNKAKCRKLFYSLNEPSANCYFDGERVLVNLFGATEKAEAAYLNSFATHNKSNALAAILACRIAGVDIEFCVDSLRNYTPLPHRLQTVAILDGVTFVDDSKATNVHATVSALSNYSQPLALILGGSDKHEKYDSIFENLKNNVKLVMATGATATKIRDAGRARGIEVKIFEDIAQATEYGFEAIKQTGGVVLMSNACASFDKFKGYAERGDYFRHAVRELCSDKKTL